MTSNPPSRNGASRLRVTPALKRLNTHPLITRPMKRCILIRPRYAGNNVKLTSRLRHASSEAKHPDRKGLCESNRQPVLSVSFDAAKGHSPYYYRTHDDMQSARDHFKKHPQQGVAIFKP